MLIFLSRDLTFLATPKTGTTAVEMALKPEAEIIFSRGRKHLTALRYRRRVLPFLQETFSASPEALAVKPKNVSPDLPAPLSQEVESRLRAARAKEFALYDRLMAADGYLRTPQ